MKALQVTRSKTISLFFWYTGAVGRKVRWRVPLFIHFEACSHLVTGTGVHRVHQRSDVDLVDRSACIESRRRHFGHMAEGRGIGCRKGGVYLVSKSNVRYVNDAQTSTNRGIERCGITSSRVFLQTSPARCSSRQNGKENTIFVTASGIAVTTKASTHTGRMQMKA